MRSMASRRKKNAANREKRPSPSVRISGASTTKAMKFVRYSKYSGEDLGISAEDLLQALADFLLESGFSTQYMPFSEWNQHTLEDLKKAIQQALEQGKLFDGDSLDEMMERLQNMSAEQMDKLLENLI